MKHPFIAAWLLLTPTICLVVGFFIGYLVGRP